MRKLSYVAGVFVLVLFVLQVILYDRIIDFIPVIRGIMAEKSLLLSMRILLINILSLAAFLILARSISCVHAGKILNRLGISILVYIMLKTGFEFLSLFNTGILHIQVYPLIGGIALLLLFGFFRYRFLFERDFWKDVRFTAREKGSLVVFMILYLALQIPVIQFLSGR